MQLDNFKRRMIVIGIGLVFILFGAAQGIFKFKMNPEVVNEGSFILMMIAAWLLFSNRRNAANPNQEKPTETAAIEESPGESAPESPVSKDNGTENAATKE